MGSEADQDSRTSSIDLTRRVREGDRRALERLFERYVPPLRRWAAGRLPRWARDGMDTDDIIQETMMNTFRKPEGFEYRHDGALQAYMRQALHRRILDELRKVKRRPNREEVGSDAIDPAASPLEETIGLQAAESYEKGLAKLSDAEREAVIARVELGQDYEQIAAALGKPSGDAARMTVARALVRLAREMGHER
jgi:RNA polymerase sigma-70 factor (ECF subfamily)